MPEIVFSEISYGGYISLAKFIPLLILFYSWILLTNWVSRDTRAVRTNTNSWVGLLLGGGLAGFIAWLLIPIYLVGLLIFLIITITITLVYVMHRNSLVASFEKILTVNHLKSLFSNENKKMEQASKGFSLITANDNPVGIPAAKSKEAHGFKIACKLLEDAIWRRANHIKLMPGKDGYAVTMTIDGVLTTSEPLTKEDTEYFIFFLKHLSDLDVEEKRKPQKGLFKASKDGKTSEWEVKTAGSRAGEHIELSKQEEYNLMTIDNIGLDEDQINKVKQWHNKKEGLVLVCGPSGSGVTSALYTLLKNHDPFLNSIVTLEKRPAAEVESITQNIFSMSDTGTSTYDKRLTSILRFGPDIVGVGDVDDAATAKVACEWASKKILYVSVNARNCMECLQKWISMVKDKKLATENLLGVVSVRLVRKLCDECREAYQPNPEMLKKLNIKPEAVKMLYRPGEIQYKRTGKPKLCEKCQGTGFYGRMAIFETAFFDEHLRKEVIKLETMKEIISACRKNGMLLLQEQGIKKVVRGELAVNELIRELKSEEKSKPSTTKA